MKRKTQKVLLFVLFASLLLLDLVIPDPLPVLDEVVLGLFVLLSAKSLKKK